MEGGLTLAQLNTLFELHQKRDFEEKKWQALLRGVNLDKELKKEKTETSYMFDNPENYEKLSDEEKKRRTEEMMKQHRSSLFM